jgi:hypothetical protein
MPVFKVNCFLFTSPDCFAAILSKLKICKPEFIYLERGITEGRIAPLANALRFLSPPSKILFS